MAKPRMGTGPEGRMSPSAFRAWMSRLGVNQQEAAQMLGATRTSVRRWSNDATPKHAPRYIALACEALEGHRELGKLIEGG